MLLVSRPPGVICAAADALNVVLTSLDEAKAEDPVSIDLTGKTTIGDHMVVATGRSDRHVAAIANRLIDDLKEAGGARHPRRGHPHRDWVLVDAGDVIVHIFRPEVRAFYNIEKMWRADHPAAPVAVWPDRRVSFGRPAPRGGVPARRDVAMTG